jgi:hypothetical protein
MAGVYFAWHEVQHLKVNLPDSVVVRDGSIVDWFYTSKAGFVMRHKQTSVSLGKLKAKFEQGGQEPDPPFALMCPFKGRPKLLLKTHFETQVSLLLNQSKTEPYHFVLQKHITPSHDTLFSCLFTDSALTVAKTQFSQEFLINGLYSKVPSSSPHDNEYLENKLRAKAWRVVQVGP